MRKSCAFVVIRPGAALTLAAFTATGIADNAAGLYFTIGRVLTTRAAGTATIFATAARAGIGAGRARFSFAGVGATLAAVIGAAACVSAAAVSAAATAAVSATVPLGLGLGQIKAPFVKIEGDGRDHEGQGREASGCRETGEGIHSGHDFFQQERISQIIIGQNPSSEGEGALIISYESSGLQ